MKEETFYIDNLFSTNTLGYKLNKDQALLVCTLKSIVLLLFCKLFCKFGTFLGTLSLRFNFNQHTEV